MAKQTINLGTAPTGQGGDTPRSANVKIGANFDELYGALGAAGTPQALPAALPVTKGGTGGTTPALARQGLQLGSAAVAAIVGELTQSGGVPTGALMQMVSNSVGTYFKFANGLLISSQRITISAGTVSWLAGNGVRYASLNYGLPVAFVGQVDLYGQMIENDIAGRSAWLTNILATSASNFTAWLSAGPSTPGVGAFSFNVIAVGRWF